PLRRQRPMFIRDRLYLWLEWFFGKTWLTVGVFFGVLVGLLLGLYLCRRSKGIRDGYLDG
ncbi:hypothetical protein ACV35G_31885, partial [Pseudomonas aeruginosa]